jgi:hypothetical protein
MLLPNLPGLLHRLLPTDLRHLIPIQNLHNLPCRRLYRPDLVSFDGFLSVRCKFSVSHLALNLFCRLLDFAQTLVNAGAARQDFAKIDSVVFAEFVGVVCGWDVRDAACGADVGVGELMGLMQSQRVSFADTGV